MSAEEGMWLRYLQFLTTQVVHLRQAAERVLCFQCAGIPKGGEGLSWEEFQQEEARRQRQGRQAEEMKDD